MESGPGRKTVVNPDGAFPLVEFSVAVGKGETTGVLVHRAAIIHGIWLSGNDRHGGIVDGPRIIIHINPDVGRAAVFKVGGFAKGGILRLGFVVNASQPRSGDRGCGPAAVGCSGGKP